MMLQQQQQQQQQPQQPQQQPQQQVPRLTERKLDPYKVLDLSKTYDKRMLKRAYLKAAMKAHPDRGGSPQLFQQVSIAYTLLTKKLKEQENSHSHEDMQSGAKDYLQTQESQPKVNVNMKDNFDGQLFNKIYEENKIKDAYDKGYGSWMEKNPAIDSGPEQTKLFQSGFNKDMFNATFDKFKQENAHQYKDQLVKYEEPEERLSMKNQDSLVTLGQGRVSDFSGSSDNLQYTDYKKAYTYGSTLIDTATVSLDGRSQSIGGIKSQRSNLSYELSPEDHKRLALQQMKEQKEEEKRAQRLNVYDQKHGQAYERIHGLLLR
jgi:curved DNA-binding protein CbpA